MALGAQEQHPRPVCDAVLGLAGSEVSLEDLDVLGLEHKLAGFGSAHGGAPFTNPPTKDVSAKGGTAFRKKLQD